MRATSQLLEVVGEEAAAIVEDSDLAGRHAGRILDAVEELRRQGDTLMWREDLRTILRHVDPLGDDPLLALALERVGFALGGSAAA